MMQKIQESCSSLEDWVQTIKWSSDGSLFCLLAHNYAMSLFHNDLSVINVFVCEEKCLLYSGHIEGEDVSNMVLFAGTVFQEILIWSPTLQNSSATCRVLHRLKGHQGVIFSLAYCQKRQLICSTSDDRSIRTWKVDFSMCDSSFKWEDATIVPHLVLHGHSARVWRSLLLEDVIVSAGEDSFICLWSYEGELLDKWQSHDGASVRCIDYSEDTKLLYSSGDDGGVFAWRIEERKPFVSEKLGFPSNDAGHPSNVIILPSGELLVIDSNGIIFKKVQNKWTQILNDFKVENATLVKAGEKYFCLGKMVGDILFYFLDDLESDKLLSSIYLKEGVVSLHWVDKQSIVVCGRHGILNLIMLNESTGIANIVAKLELPNSKERVSTVAAWITDTSNLIIGDRDGNISLYVDVLEQTNSLLAPVCFFKHAHGKQGVSDVMCTNSSTVVSAGRDSSVKKFHFDKETNTLVLLSEVHEKNGWISRFVQDDIQLGFYGNHFFIRTEGGERTMASIVCGGAQRSWDYHHTDGQLIDTFCFIKERALFKCNINRDVFKKVAIKSGFHTKVINTATIVKKTHGDFLLISGSDDTTIRLSLFSHSMLKWSKKFKFHRSSVRAVAVCSLGGSLQFLISGGGRAELCISKILDRGSEIELMQTCSHMLRGLVAQGFDPETRYNDLKITDALKDSFVVYCSCSDGEIRKFFYSVPDQKLSLISHTNWHNHCVLKTAIAQKYVFSTATDGRIATWDVDSFSREAPQQVYYSHQSGVNDIDVFTVNNDLVVASGGDDGKIFAKVVGSAKEWSRESAHSAQITGVRWLSASLLVSVSSDQRISVWKINNDNAQLEHVQTVCTTVSDIHGVYVLHPQILVYGNGFEFFNFEVK
ncbi:tRNA (34-2'-O)-methyltransferase regulator WDR6-like isoform X3 [Artemia franciscana]|uniref:tRNA (34-2'-O)-methyltransferase regulator WDR6-like isoform X3 n=1 Tax=Artemia franciscana TaxID=6661 RepID=UPI0032DA5E3E